MRKIVTKAIQTATPIQLHNLKDLDNRAATCDYIVAYKTIGGLIAKLVSYNASHHRSRGWIAGFNYIEQDFERNNLKFEGNTHAEAIKKAINSGRDVLLFKNEFEFIQFCINDERLMQQLVTS